MEKPYQPKTHEEFMRYTNKEMLAALQEIKKDINMIKMGIGFFILLTGVSVFLSLFGF